MREHHYRIPKPGIISFAADLTDGFTVIDSGQIEVRCFCGKDWPCPVKHASTRGSGLAMCGAERGVSVIPYGDASQRFDCEFCIKAIQEELRRQ